MVSATGIWGPLLTVLAFKGEIPVMGRFFYIMAGTFFLLGLFWTVGEKYGIGQMPGDFKFQRGNTVFLLPLGSSLIISFVISLLMWLFDRLRGPRGPW